MPYPAIWNWLDVSSRYSACVMASCRDSSGFALEGAVNHGSCWGSNRLTSSSFTLMVETKVPRFCFFFSFFFGSFSLVLFFINFSMKKIRPGAWVPASRPVRATRLWSGHGSRPGRAQVGLCGVVIRLTPGFTLSRVVLSLFILFDGSVSMRVGEAEKIKSK